MLATVGCDAKLMNRLLTLISANTHKAIAPQPNMRLRWLNSECFLRSSALWRRVASLSAGRGARQILTETFAEDACRDRAAIRGDERARRRRAGGGALHGPEKPDEVDQVPIASRLARHAAPGQPPPHQLAELAVVEAREPRDDRRSHLTAVGVGAVARRAPAVENRAPWIGVLRHLRGGSCDERNDDQRAQQEVEQAATRYLPHGVLPISGR